VIGVKGATSLAAYLTGEIISVEYCFTPLFIRFSRHFSQSGFCDATLPIWVICASLVFQTTFGGVASIEFTTLRFSVLEWIVTEFAQYGFPV
jgi:hypothetical protein